MQTEKGPNFFHYFVFFVMLRNGRTRIFSDLQSGFQCNKTSLLQVRKKNVTVKASKYCWADDLESCHGNCGQRESFANIKILLKHFGERLVAIFLRLRLSVR